MAQLSYPSGGWGREVLTLPKYIPVRWAVTPS